jgi:hypothetical protein
MASLLTSARERVQGFFLEPAEPTLAPGARGGAPAGPRGEQPRPGPVEAIVLGLCAGCGASTVARGLVLMLASRQLRPGHLLVVERGGAQPAPPGPGSGPAAVVWDVAPSEVERVTAAALTADAVLLVAPGSGEPALAELVARALRERFGSVSLVANRVGDRARWSGRAAACVPQSRLGAALAARGRRPPGAFGAALAELAALVEGRP